MSIRLRVLSGALAGRELVLEKSIIVAGRHPLCDLRFDAERDRDVSTRHAEIRAAGDAWVVRDLGSTNGTYLNGERIVHERALSAGDALAFGEHGPRVDVASLSPHADANAETPALAHRAPAPAPVMAAVAAGDRVRRTVPSQERPAAARPTTGERVAQAVRESTRGLRLLVVAAFGLLLIAVGTGFWVTRRGDTARDAEVAALLRRNDSLTTAFEREMGRVASTVQGLDSALAGARAEGDSLRARLARARSPEDISALTAQLERVQSQRARLLSVGRLDATATAADNGPAVAFLAVKMADGTMYTGTAFAVSTDGLLVTNRHLVHDAASGEAAKQLLVKFNGSRQWLPVRLVQLATTDDLALLRVEGRGPWPAVRGVAEGSMAVGAPTVLLGFPLGMDTPMEGEGIDDFTAATTLATATVSKVLPDVVQLDAYAGEGSSGSPVFDHEGRVAGVVYGGARASGGRIVYAVPAERLRKLLAAVPGR
jgi:S1-C subfamily serine protease